MRDVASAVGRHMSAALPTFFGACELPPGEYDPGKVFFVDSMEQAVAGMQGLNARQLAGLVQLAMTKVRRAITEPGARWGGADADAGGERSWRADAAWLAGWLKQARRWAPSAHRAWASRARR
jgi:hypothetical protein